MRLLLSAALVVCGSAVASAQLRDSVRTDSAHHLERVVVSESRLGEIGVGSSAASVTAIDLRRTPAGPTRVADAIARIPGVSLFNDQGNRTQPTLDVRGFTLSPVVGVPQGISVFLDGVRLNEPDAQEVNFDLIPAEAVESAEMIRGPSAQFGKNTLGGALTLRTIRGSAEPRLEAGVSAGSFGYRDAHLLAAGMLGAIDGALTAHASADQGYQRQSGGRTSRVFGTVGRRAENGDVALSVLYARDRLYEAGSLPASWIPVARRANYSGGDFFRPQVMHAALRFENAWGAGVTARGNVFVRRNAIEQFNVNVSSPNTRAFIDNLSVGATMETSVATALIRMPLVATAGVEAAGSRVSYRLFDEPATPAQQLPPDCDAASGPCERARVPESDGAAYAQIALSPGAATSVLLSARADAVRIPFRDLRAPENDGTDTFVHVSPKLGLTRTISPELRLYASAGSGFRAPAALELACASETAPCPLPFSLGADPALAPVIAWNYEVGTSWRARASTRLDAALFRTDVRDEIAFVTSSAAAGYFQNLHRTRREGVELSGESALPDGVRISASYTFLDATYQSFARLASALDSNAVERGTHMALSPRHRATAGLDVTRLMGSSVVSTSITARAASSQLLRGDEAAHAPPLPGFVVADARVTVARSRIAATLDVSNLLDRRYASYGIYAENRRGAFGGPPPADASVERFLTPALPRTISLSVDVTP